MTPDVPGPSPQEPSHPSEFDVSALENPAQRLLRDEFTRLAAHNASLIADFDPLSTSTHTEIELNTAFPEAEKTEPTVTDALHINMLNRLGLTPAIGQKGKPDTLFEYQWADGNIDQIRFITRQDGVKIPIATKLLKQGTDYIVDQLTLLSNDAAQAYKEDLENHINEAKINRRLLNEFGLDTEFTERAGLNLDDKTAMLAAYDQIQQLEIKLPDLSEINSVRNKLMRSMLPGFNFFRDRRRANFPNLALKYMGALTELVKSHDLPDEGTSELLQRERLLRLTSLNERLKKRKRNAKLGVVAVTSTLTLIGGGAGAAAGYIGSLEHLPYATPITGGLIGATSGLMIGAEQALRLRKGNKQIYGFPAALPGATLVDQLHEEYSLARYYVWLTSQNQSFVP